MPWSNWHQATVNLLKLAESRLLRSLNCVSWSAGIWHDIKRKKMWSLVIKINCHQLQVFCFCFFLALLMWISRNRHLHPCLHSKIRTELLIFKRKDQRDRLLLVIGHHHLSCSFPWKIALRKESYFWHYISDLDKHLGILCSVETWANVFILTCNTKIFTWKGQGCN